MILRVLPAVAYILVGPSMLDGSKVMMQTKRDTLVFQVWVGHGVDNPTPQKALIAEKLLMIAAGRKHLKRLSKIKDLQQEGTWNVLPLYRSGALRNLMEVLALRWLDSV
jgi:hypothetical protein